MVASEGKVAVRNVSCSEGTGGGAYKALDCFFITLYTRAIFHVRRIIPSATTRPCRPVRRPYIRDCIRLILLLLLLLGDEE